MPRSQQSYSSTVLLREVIFDHFPQRILDVGCGSDAKWGTLLRGLNIDGIEAHRPSAEASLKHLAYDMTYVGDIRHFVRTRTFFERGYDAIILGDVLEHLAKEEAISLIKFFQKHCLWIYLTLPVVICEQGVVGDNHFEEHKYHWSDQEIRFFLDFKLLEFSLNENRLVCVGSYIWSQSPKSEGLLYGE
jgi:hypothetical protein